MCRTQIEIERKYLVEITGELPDGELTDIWQTYLLSEDGCCRRVRQRGSNGSYRYYLTEKRPLAYDRRIETEGEISESEYEALLCEADPEKRTIRKRRCCFQWQGQSLELDTFIEPVMQYHLLEIEGAESAEAVIWPPFLKLVRDVTGEKTYSNAHISCRGVMPEATGVLLVKENVSLQSYNTFGIDVKARKMVSLRCRADYEALLQSDWLHNNTFVVLGGGSNMVFTQDFDDVIVHPNNANIRLLEQRDGHYYIEAEAGVVWDEFVRRCMMESWFGVENLAAIPGTVGAAPVQNVGAYGVEAKDIIDRVYCFDITTGAERVLTCEECGFGYRWSVFKGELKNRMLVERVVFRLNVDYQPHLGYKALTASLAERGITQPTAQQVADVVRAVRCAKLPDPKFVGSAGSFFKNPVVSREAYLSLCSDFPNLVAFPVEGDCYKLAAGWLIEHAGWKGASLGRAGVYEKQALVLVNRGGCSGDEVKHLAETIIADVEARFHVRLETEAIFVHCTSVD